jgi:hypothetical protein
LPQLPPTHEFPVLQSSLVVQVIRQTAPVPQL